MYPMYRQGYQQLASIESAQPLAVSLREAIFLISNG